MSEKKMMRLTHFCEEYDIPVQTARDWTHSKGFPAFKLGERWYVDIAMFEKWRERQHRQDYKYA